MNDFLIQFQAELSDLWRAELRFLPQQDRTRAAELMTRWEHAVRQTVL